MALLFQDILDKYFPRLDRIVEKINGKRNANVSYLHEEMLRTEYCPTQTFDSSQFNNFRVSASWVDIDSPLPVMKRDGIKVQSNALPIFGMELQLSNKQINDLKVMQAQGYLTEEILGKVLADAVKCTNGMREALEGAFLQGLSLGGCTVPAPLNSDNYNKKDFRIDYGYLESNKYGVKAKWADKANADPISDIENVLENADITLSNMFISKKTFSAMRKTEAVKRFVANKNGVVVLEGAKYPTPTASATKDAIESEYGLSVQVIDRTIYVEKNGKREKWQPWADEKVVFTSTTQLGALAYGKLPEEYPEHQVAGVQYAKPLVYALVSKFADKRPLLTEITQIVGMVAPIVENTDEIYQMDVTEAQELDSTAEGSDSTDVKLTIYGTAYNKTAVVSALKAVGVNAKANMSDKTLLNLINELSNEDEAKFKSVLTA